QSPHRGFCAPRLCQLTLPAVPAGLNVAPPRTAAPQLRRPLLLAFCAADVFRLQAFRPLLHVEFDSFSLVEGPVTARLDGGVMNEDVLTGIALEEAVAFVIVEPLHSTNFGHYPPPAA